jgi:hypothetical protein
VREVCALSPQERERLVAQLLQQEGCARHQAGHLVLLLQRQAQALLEELGEAESAATRRLHARQAALALAAAVQPLGLDEADALVHVGRLKLHRV